MRNEVIMESLLTEEKGSLSVQTSPFCRRLRIEEPILMKSNATKDVARCLFGVPDPVECQRFATSADERSMLEFKRLWSFDPMTGEPINAALDSSSMIELYKWEQVVFSEELIQGANEEQVVTPQLEPEMLHVTPASESRTAEVECLATTDADTDVTISETMEHILDDTIQLTEVPLELRDTSIPEDPCGINPGSSNNESNTSMETVSPKETRFKSPKSLKQCRITDYMQVIKKPRAKKLR